MFSVLLFTVKEAGRVLTGFWYCFVSGDKDETFIEIWEQGLQKMMLVMRHGGVYLGT